jgi:hypothetical protein
LKADIEHPTFAIGPRRPKLRGEAFNYGVKGGNGLIRIILGPTWPHLKASMVK